MGKAMIDKAVAVIDGWKPILNLEDGRYYLTGRTAKEGEISTPYISCAHRGTVETDDGEILALGRPDSDWEANVKALNPLWSPERPLAGFAFSGKAPVKKPAKDDFLDPISRTNILKILAG